MSIAVSLSVIFTGMEGCGYHFYVWYFVGCHFYKEAFVEPIKYYSDPSVYTEGSEGTSVTSWILPMFLTPFYMQNIQKLECTCFPLQWFHDYFGSASFFHFLIIGTLGAFVTAIVFLPTITHVLTWQLCNSPNCWQALTIKAVLSNWSWS